MPADAAVIFTEQADWHSRRLGRAIEARGLRCLILSLRDCGFAIGTTRHGMVLPGLEGELPRGAFVRIIPNGTTEQITARLGLLHALRELGVIVCNDARAIERCVDKSMTNFLLAHAGVPTPRSWSVEHRAWAQSVVDAAEGDTVLKPLFGAQGRGLRRLPRGAEMPSEEAVDGVYHLQEFVDSEASTRGDGWHDWRVLVVGDRPVAAMIRRGTGWITNIHQGAAGEPAAVDGEAGRLAVAATRAVGADYAGVDLIEGRDGGFVVIECNSMPAWKGLQRTTEIDIADALAAHFVGALAA